MVLQDWIRSEVDSEELLPLCHTTKWETFEKILKAKKLSKNFSKFPDPNPWKTKIEKMVYLFYGMPFYIYEIGDEDDSMSESTEDLPIGLIFKPELSNDVDRFYPFDTGALLSNMYSKVLKAKSEADYKVYEVQISDGTEMKKFVKRYYCQNEKYCVGETCNANKPSCPKEENLFRLFNFKSTSKLDLRQRAIEIHSLNDIPLLNKLQAIILPKIKSRRYKYLVDEIKLTFPNIDIEYYMDFFKFSSESIRAVLLETTAEYYDKNSSMGFNTSNLS